MRSRIREFFVLGLFLFFGLAALGYFISTSPASFRAYERSVNVKGLSEREVMADTAIWPIMFSVAGNDIADVYRQLEQDRQRVMAFLAASGFPEESISVTAPSVVDKVAQNYGGQAVAIRYNAQQTITVYSGKVLEVRAAKARLAELGKAGVLLSGNDYAGATEYLFTGLNEIKPGMVEEATRNAREVAIKFARDSESTLGKIKSARQGQFSIGNRDCNNPHIKKVRVVSTIEYYLSD